MPALKIHPLNCGTLCPRAVHSRRARDLLKRGEMVCHCWLIESPHSLLLVDTGVGLEDCRRGYGRLYDALIAPRYLEAECAITQVRALGFDPRDVRHLVLTHLDLDHAGGLADFPWAKVHVHRAELEAAQQRRGLNSRQRYLRRQIEGVAAERWRTYDTQEGAALFGLEGTQELRELGPDLRVVPLFGHSAGHCGVAARTARGWQLHGGDAWFHHGDLLDPPSSPPLLRFTQRLLCTDNAQRLRNVHQLRRLAADPEAPIALHCAHDPHDLARALRHLGDPLAHRPQTEPQPGAAEAGHHVA